MIDTGTNTGKAAFAVALAAVVVGVCVFAGWLFDLELLKRIVPGLVAMNPATAIAFILAGASLALFLQPAPGGDQKAHARILTARLCALAVTLIGLAKLVGIMGWDIGVDRWFFASKMSDGLQFPNRIAPNTAFNFLLLGGALLLVDAKQRSVRIGVELFVLVVGFGSLLAVLAYVYDLQLVYGLGAFLRMALHTAITFLGLAVALLLSHTDRGLLAIFAGDNPGGALARRLLPAAVLVPAGLGWLTLQGERAGIYHGNFNEAVFAAGNILVFTLLVCWSAKRLASADLERKQVVEALRDSEARTVLLVKSASVGLWDWNLVTNEVFFSAEWKRQLGYTDAELPSGYAEWESRLHPDDRERILASIVDYREGRRADFEVEFRLRHKDGSWRWILARANLTRNPAGQPVRMTGGHIDITERKRIEAALRVSELEFRALAEAMPQMVWITRPDGWNIYFSRQWMDYTGLTLEESLGHGWNQPFHPEDQQRAWAAWQHATTAVSTYSLECRLRRADGVYRWWLIRGVPQRDASGHILKWFGTCTDIHDLKVAELEISRTNRELQESEEKFRQLADNVAEVFWINSPDLQRMHYVSPAYEQIWGRSVESLYANPRQWGEAILPEERAGVFAVFSQLTTDKPTASAEFRIARPDGAVRWILSRGFQVRDGAGKVIRITGIASDITERKRAQAELEATHGALVEASRRSGMAEIATNVLHNVGNVLNSVNISTALMVESVKHSRTASLAKVVSLLQEHAPDLGEFMTQDAKGKQVPAYLAQLSEQLLADQAALGIEVDSLRRNVEHIKVIVAMQQSYATFGGVKEMINVTTLVEDSLRMNEGALSRHHVEVIREFEPVPPMNVEKHKILQVLVNLLRNAKYACDDSGRTDKRLTLRVSDGAGSVKISVMDNGVGIPPENLTRIFNHGFTTRKGGHGFGLHSGALAAKEMGGSLTVHSAGPGQGATFTLELPVDRTPPTA